MTNPTPLLKACKPRNIRQAGDQYAADIVSGLAQELANSEAAADFLETTHLTKATGDFLRMATDRVRIGPDSTAPSVYQLYSRYGGGKTHSLLLLAAAAKFPTLTYWRDQAGLQPTAAKVVAFDGAKHDVTGARINPDANPARSLAGHLLYQLGGPQALEKFADGDAAFTDPGSETFRNLIGDRPTFIVIDELVQYISRLNQLRATQPNISGDGVITTIAAVADAVVNSPRAALVITTPENSSELLAENPDQNAGDAFPIETLALTDMLNRVNSQLGRVMHPIAPSTESDLPAILRKRLFSSIDEAARQNAAHAYAEVAHRNGRANGDMDYQGFYEAYPFHPALLNLITGRLSANRNFQRVRGTLRLLANTLLHMQENGGNAALIHPHHVDPHAEPIRDELVNRTGFSQLDPAIDRDIIGAGNTAVATGNALATPAAITMLMGTIAPDNSNGLYETQIADAILSPEHDDFGVIHSAIRQFLQQAIHVDDSADTQRKRFSQDPNVMKELLEIKESILADTGRMDQLFRNAIHSAYGPKRNDQFDIELFPSRESNLPDDAGKATLGVVNPDHWNYTQAADPANGMSERDILVLHRHSMGNNGRMPRQYPNNALLLAAHDADFGTIREQLAQMEAADQLLQEKGDGLTEQRRQTLESARAESEKNATTGIQNKFTHLFSAGNSPQAQYPEASSHLERRVLNSMTDAVGKGQEAILEALGDQVLRGSNAALNRSVWQRVGMLARADGCTLEELRDHFARTPDLRIVMNEDTWRSLIAHGVKEDFLHVRTESGEQNPDGYDPRWKVWGKGHEPQPQPSKPVKPTSPPGPPTPPPRPPQPSQRQFQSGKQPGNAAFSALRNFMNSNGYDWSNVESCRLEASNPEVATFIANVAQAHEQGIEITMRTQNTRLRLEIINEPPGTFQQQYQSAKRMMDRADAENADVQVHMAPDIAPQVLPTLNGQTDVDITVEFQSK